MKIYVTQFVEGCFVVVSLLPGVYQFVGGFCNDIIKVVLGCKIIYILFITENTSEVSYLKIVRFPYTSIKIT
jgi:hypothetical protein